MRYREVLPPEQIRNYIKNIWIFEVFENENQNFPVKHNTISDPCISVVIIRQPFFSGIRLLGPHTKSYSQSIYANSFFLGIRFYPWVTFPFIDKSRLLNKTNDIPEVMNFVEDRLSKEHFCPGYTNFDAVYSALESFLNVFEPQVNNLVKYICLELSTGKSVSSIVDDVPASVRIIQKTFKKVTAITMKQYANSVRERKVWEDILLHGLSQTDAVLQHGYYDHAHFINAFKNKMQLSPEKFKKLHGSIDLSLA